MTTLTALCVASLVAASLAVVTVLLVRHRRPPAVPARSVAPTPTPNAAQRSASREPAGLDSSCVDPSLRRVLAVEVLSPPVTPRYLPVVLRYDLIDPYAVRAEFQLPGASNCWVFARDLLARGLRSAVGDGDVRIWPVDGDGLRITLLSPDGEALVQADAAGVDEFLQQTYVMCPHGREGEHVDVDALLRSMLAS
ncbi:MAG TPA: SsgA family sporulation/cell division regulator [Actinomycetes bacterium]|nr:SsgA family sporulation/cell division regulator [Actinomycetes bacterium]